MRDACLNAVHTLAQQDPRVVFIGSDLGPTTLRQMREEFPDRFFMEGIAEQHVVGMAAGMAMDGLIPYVNTIATFLTRRCFEQVAVDCCYHDLPVRLLGNGGGLIYAPLGPTHQATDDIALMRLLPNMAIICPMSRSEMTKAMLVTLNYPHPIYFRISRGTDCSMLLPAENEAFEIGKAVKLYSQGSLLPTTILSTGIMSHLAVDAALVLRGDYSIPTNVLHFPTVKPLDTHAISSAAQQSNLLVVVEEHSRIGGLGSAVMAVLQSLQINVPFIHKALPDRFQKCYGTQDELLEHNKLTVDDIVAAVIAR